MEDFVTEQCRRRGLDLTTARRDSDGVCRANVCPPLSEGHWELNSNDTWEHVPPKVQQSIGDIWARGNF